MYHKIKIFSRAHDTSVGRRKHTINRETHRQSYQKFYFATLHQLSTLDHLVMPCYCSYSRKSFLSLRPKPHLQMYSGIGPMSPTTQGCSATACKVIRSPGSLQRSLWIKSASWGFMSPGICTGSLAIYLVAMTR